MPKSSTRSRQPQRAVGLDKPCTKCGQPIYYNYKGPIEGLCGRCADRVLRSRRIERTKTVVVASPSASRRLLTAALIAFLAGAAAMYLVYPYLMR